MNRPSSLLLVVLMSIGASGTAHGQVTGSAPLLAPGGQPPANQPPASPTATVLQPPRPAPTSTSQLVISPPYGAPRVAGASDTSCGTGNVCGLGACKDFCGDSCGVEDRDDAIPSIFQPGIGVYFLWPFWTSRDFTVSVPGTTGPNTLILSDARDVTHGLEATPVVTVGMCIGEDLTLELSGMAYQLNSNLTQTVSSAAGTATLDAYTKFGFYTIDAIKVGYRMRCPKLFKCFEDETLVFFVGPRYSKISQQYHAELAAAGAGATKTVLDSSQNFSGFGATVGFYGRTKGHQVDVAGIGQGRINFYGSVRGAFLGGNNHLATLYSFANGPPTTTNSTDTDYIPIGELECGIEFRKEMHFRSRKSCKSYDGEAGLRVGFVGQVWGDVGLPNPMPGSGAAFDNGSLYLAGFGVLFDVEF